MSVDTTELLEKSYQHLAHLDLIQVEAELGQSQRDCNLAIGMLQSIVMRLQLLEASLQAQSSQESS